ncbi:MAG TPA: ABC transporter permease [Thermoanaerobaculia bacterium]|jgi:putative ABC transport system permease protein
MKIHEALLTSLANISAHKLRSALTMLGIVFGVGAVIAMLSIGAGAEQQALETIARLGLHNVVVRAKELKEDEAQEIRAKSLGVSLRDSEAIADAVPGVELVAPKVDVDPYQVIAAGGESGGAAVYGVAAEHARLVDLTISEGRFLDPLDVRGHAQAAVIGAAVRRDLFGHGPAVGEHFKVNDLWFEVVGVIDAGGGEVDAFQGVAIASAASAIYVPVSTALRKFDRDPLDSPLTEIVVRLREAESGRQAARVIEGLLDHLHAGADDYELVVPEALLAESRRTQRLFNVVMGCIAGISLLVGGIGIMNIMLATVLERTREIGIRRAVGARRHDILFQFIVESFSLSALGGVAGIVMGVVIARVVAASAGWPTLVTLWSILLATGVAMTVGLSSGIYPAFRAARLDPIESLRYE